MVAARSGKADVVEQLLPKGANANARAARGQTALMWAAAQRHPEVVKVLLAHGADVHARSDVWSQMMAVPPHGLPQYNRVIPHGGDTALLFAARVGDLELGDAARRRGRERERRRCLGRQRHDDGRACRLRRDRRVPARSRRRSERRQARLHRAARRDHAAAHARWSRALLAHGADPNAPVQAWTPTRRSSKDYNFAPELVGATPFWLAARFNEPDVMRLLLKHGADPLVRASRQLPHRGPGRATHAGHHRGDGGDGNGRRRRVGAARSPRARSG